MRINESSQAQITVEFYDFSFALAAPATIRYKLTDEETETELVPWTTLTPAESVVFTIPATANRIINDRRKWEPKVLTVQTDEGLASQHTEQEVYEVVNLAIES